MYPCLQPVDKEGHIEVPNDMPSRDELLLKLQVFINEMKAAEHLVAPTLRWDPLSTDEKEVLAVARIGLLISDYEPQYYWSSNLCCSGELLITRLWQT